MATRIEYIDSAKGIAILCIVAGHLGFVGFDGTDLISRFVFQFHVPVFYILAGYFLSTRQSISEFVKSKSMRLLLPYVFTCAVIFLVAASFYFITGTCQPPTIFPNLKRMVIAALYGAGTPNSILPDGVMHIGAIWFLEALLFGLVEVRLCLKLNRFAIVPIVILSVVALISSRVLWLPLNIQSGCVAGLYVYIGVCFRKRDVLAEPISLPIFMLLSLIVIVAFYANITVSLVSGYLGPCYLGLPVSVTASLWCLCIARYIDDYFKGFSKILSFYGKNSLVVLCTHLALLDLGFKYALHTAFHLSGNMLFLVNFALQLMLCALFIVICMRLPVVRKVFY